jgi:hypothetical protein
MNAKVDGKVRAKFCRMMLATAATLQTLVQEGKAAGMEEDPDCASPYYAVSRCQKELVEYAVQMPGIRIACFDAAEKEGV